MNNAEPLGLRDRKRIETRARLERAAVTLVLRDGLENTTVDAISELADVSPRTFFNYFDSKDSAILGIRPTEYGDRAVAAHLEDPRHEPLVDSVVRLLFSVSGAPLSVATIGEDRMEVIRRYPQLLADQLAQLTQIAGKLTEAVQTLLGTDPAFADLASDERPAQAEVLLSLCVAAVRVSVRQWAATGNEADETELQRRATALVHDTLGRLT